MGSSSKTHGSTEDGKETQEGAERASKEGGGAEGGPLDTTAGGSGENTDESTSLEADAEILPFPEEVRKGGQNGGAEELVTEGWLEEADADTMTSPDEVREGGETGAEVLVTEGWLEEAGIRVGDECDNSAMGSDGGMRAVIEVEESSDTASWLLSVALFFPALFSVSVRLFTALGTNIIIPTCNTDHHI